MALFFLTATNIEFSFSGEGERAKIFLVGGRQFSEPKRPYGNDVFAHLTHIRESGISHSF